MRLSRRLDAFALGGEPSGIDPVALGLGFRGYGLGDGILGTEGIPESGNALEAILISFHVTMFSHSQHIFTGYQCIFSGFSTSTLESIAPRPRRIAAAAPVPDIVCVQEAARETSDAVGFPAKTLAASGLGPWQNRDFRGETPPPKRSPRESWTPDDLNRENSRGGIDCGTGGLGGVSKSPSAEESEAARMRSVLSATSVEHVKLHRTGRL